MLPRLPVNNVADPFTHNSKLAADFGLRGSLGYTTANFKHVLCRQFGGVMPFPLLSSAVANLISFIYPLCTPRQIRQPIVVTNTIQMTALMVLGTKPNKGFKYQSMHESRAVPPSITPQPHCLITTTAQARGQPVPFSRCLAAARPATPNASISSHFVSPEPWDCTILDGDARISFRHAQTPVSLRVFRGSFRPYSRAGLVH